MQPELRLLYGANYLLALTTSFAVVAFLMDKPFWMATVIALAIVVVLAVLVKLAPPDVEDVESPRVLMLGHKSLLMAHVLFWPSVIGINVLKGDLGTLVAMFGGMMLIPGAVISGSMPKRSANFSARWMFTRASVRESLAIATNCYVRDRFDGRHPCCSGRGRKGALQLIPGHQIQHFSGRRGLWA